MLKFALALVVAAPVFCETPLTSVAPRVWSQPLVLPAESKLVSLEPGSDDPRFVYTIRRSFSPDGLKEEWVSNHATTTLIFRPDGRLISEHHENQFRQTGIDVTVDAGRSSVRTVITEKGTIKSDHTVGLNPGVFLREELDFLAVQSWRAGIRDVLAAQVPRPEGDLIGDCTVVFRTTSDPTTLSKKYQYPDEFRAAFGKGPYVVADMSLRGFASLFFPHHFYLIYIEKAGGLEFAGYIGGDPKLPVFQYAVK